jgi:uncharacterized protein DUF4314
MRASSGLIGSTLFGIRCVGAAPSRRPLKIGAASADPPDVGQNAAHLFDEGHGVPKKGDRIELLKPRTGVHLRGTVFHVDQVQILVKWDDGRSESLQPDVDRFRIVESG